MNKVILMGRLTRDPEVRYGGQDNQMAIARFSLAVDRQRRRQGENAEADFFNCTAFGKLGEFVERYLKQGTKILLTGRLQNDNYTNREGQKVYSTQIMVDEIEFAESKSAQGGTSSQQSAPQQGFAPNNVTPAQGFPEAAAPSDGFMNIPDDVDDGELPFN